MTFDVLALCRRKQRLLLFHKQVPPQALLSKSYTYSFKQTLYQIAPAISTLRFKSKLSLTSLLGTYASCFQNASSKLSPAVTLSNQITLGYWFNWKARSSKREHRKAAKSTSHFSDIDLIRYKLYIVKGSYKRLISNSRNKFFAQMSRDIERGKELNWLAFK